MFKKFILTLFIIFLSFTNVSALQNANIEVFDIDKGIVIKNIKSNSKIEEEMENCLKEITGVLTKFNPIPNKGYMVKIPLESPVRIDNKWLSAFIDEVIIIFPEDEKPYLMVLDNKDKTLFFNFKGNTDCLLKSINLP